MRRLSRRLVLPVFGVLWITVLLFFWVNKNKLEVSKVPEVQPTKVRGLAARRAPGSRLPEGALLARQVCRLPGSQGGGSGCSEQVTGCRVRL